MDLTRFRAALVDMDGTLYDSMPSHARAWHRMISELGMDCTVEEFFLYEGMTGAATIDMLLRRGFGRAAREGEAAELYARKSQYFSQMPRVPVIEGAREVLEELRSRGLATVLVTGSSQPTTLARLDSDYPGFFPAGRRVTARDVTRGKPHPEPFLRAALMAGVDPGECLVLENAPLGVESGHRAGCHVIGVTTGPVPAGALLEAGADQVFPSMRHLLEELRKGL